MGRVAPPLVAVFAAGAIGFVGVAPGASTAARVRRIDARHGPPFVRVPRVVGDRARAARRRLRAHGLKPSFIPTSAYSADEVPCLRPAPKSRVYSQYPLAGTRRRSGARVYVSTDTTVQVHCRGTPPAAPRACESDQFRFRVRSGIPEFAGGGEDRYVGLGVRSSGADTCELRKTARVELVGRSGHVLESVAGSPAILRIHTRLTPKTLLIAEWVWPSWCGRQKRVTVRVQVDGERRERGRQKTPYYCSDRGSEIGPYRFLLLNLSGS